MVLPPMITARRLPSHRSEMMPPMIGVKNASEV